MDHETDVDRMLADPRLAAVMAEWTARLKAGRPYRWHRLVHVTMGVQGQGPDLALVTDMKWRLAQRGIDTTLVSEWR
jgi:hypothetical protein